MPSRKKKAENGAVVAVFQDRASAERAVQQLLSSGFKDDEIGLVAKNAAGEVETTNAAGETLAEEGAVGGAVVGAAGGALIGLGVLAGVIPVVGPAIMAGTLGTILSNAAAGAAIAGITGALVGWGIPEEDAAYYEGEVQAGRFLVTVSAAGDRASEAWNILHGHGAYNRSTAASQTSAASHAVAAPATTGRRSAAASSSSSASARAEGGTTVQLKEEELRVNKTKQKAGEVEVRKEVHVEHKQITVPVEREEIVIERRPASGHAAATAGTISADGRTEEIRIPVKEEKVRVSKEAVVKEEVSIGKRKVHDTETVAADLKKEELKVEETGDVTIRGKGTSSTTRKKS